MTEPATRNALRRELRACRAALSRADQARAARRLPAQLLTLRQFRAARRVACYLPNDGEIDPIGIMERVWTTRRLCYLPLLSRLSHDRLWFAPYTPDTPLAGNRFGILEPRVPARLWLRAQDLDAVLMPLVGFDETGNRLGMGGGFYDRSLAFLEHRGHWRKPHLIGLAHDCQRLAHIDPAPWDVPLDAVATDRALYLFPNRR